MSARGPRLNVLVTALGTRGDIVPLIAVATALARRGHGVSVAADRQFHALAADAALEFMPITETERHDQERWMAAAATRTAQIEGADIYGERCKAYLLAALGDTMPTLLPKLKLAMRDADVIFCNIAMFGLIELLARRATTDPAVRRSRAGHDRRLVVAVPYHGTDCIPLRTSPYPKLLMIHSTFVKVLESALPEFAAAVRDNPTWALAGGLDTADRRPWTPPEALVAFLTRARRPVFVSLGSMRWLDSSPLGPCLAEAGALADADLIIERGGLELEGVDETDRLLVVDHVAHAWILPRVAAVVHHGGGGTVATVLAHGKPSVVLPQWSDQPFWGDVLETLECSGGTIGAGELTAVRLADCLRRALAPRLARQAAAVRQAFPEEDGAERAAAFIESYGRGEPVEFLPTPAVAAWAPP